MIRGPLMKLLLASLVVLGVTGQTMGQDAVIEDVGPGLVPTYQVLRPAGRGLEFEGRPVDVTLTPDGKWLCAKDNRGLVFINRETWTITQQLPFPSGGSSIHGIAATADSKGILATTAQDKLHEARLGDDGKWNFTRAIALPGPEGEGSSHATGIALIPDEKRAYVALSRNNSVAEVDLEAGAVLREIPVGVAPFDVVLSADGKKLYVSNWGGRHPREGEPTAPSSGTPVLIDDRGVAASGTVGCVDLATGTMTAEVATGLHPADLVLDAQRGRLYVANANSDSVSVLGLDPFEVVETIAVRPDADLPFGSASNALALSEDGGTLYVANGGNNAVGVVRLGESGGDGARLEGFIPTAWYPGSLELDGGRLYVANVKGLGSRGSARKPGTEGRSVYSHLGLVSEVELPDATKLAEYTDQVKADSRVPVILRAQERAELATEIKPVPVPARLGEPSVFEHVVYVIKENRTYDQVFGDMPQGRGDPELCIFGREVSPNHHALAEEFVLLDNFYCNGVNSADGHSWATEANVTDHLEKAFGGFTRSYTFGDDPLTYSSTGFLWDNALLHGLTFRNYGELDDAQIEPAGATFVEILRDHREGTGKITFRQSIGIASLARYSSPTTPGWNMRIPDVLRADRFLAELAEFEREGNLPNLITLHLPQDHGSGTSPGMPTPRSHMADNDLAVGKVVEGLSKSKFWPKTVVFIIEDDPQNGFDHIDGHRSVCLVASPYSRRKAVVHDFYNQTAVVHTIERILGCPPMNQMDARSPLMTACFTEEADFTPYEALPANIALDELNKPMSELDPKARFWAERSLEQDFAGVDRVDDDMLNRIIWHSVKGVDAPYPAHLAGPHGKGLARLGLIRDESAIDDDDD